MSPHQLIQICSMYHPIRHWIVMRPLNRFVPFLLLLLQLLWVLCLLGQPVQQLLTAIILNNFQVAPLNSGATFYILSSMRKFKKFGALILAGSVVAISLYWMYKLLSSETKHNNFNRTFLSISLGPIAEVDNLDSVTGIAGIDEKYIYFQVKRLGVILKTDHALHTIEKINYYHTDDQLISSRFEDKIAFGNVYTFAGNKPSIIISSPEAKSKQYIFPNAVFSRCVPISKHTFIFRGFDTSVPASDMVFIKGDLYSDSIKVAVNLTRREDEAGIPSDGLLKYDTTTHNLLYVYFYKNQMLCFDTNLNKVYIATTIDSSTKNTITSEAYKKDGITKFTNNSPKRTVNRQCCIYRGKLYNNSLIKGDNESLFDFKDNDVIDIYATHNGNYLGSFHIPHYRREHLMKFIVNKGIIAVLYKHYIVTYSYSNI